MSHLSVTQTLLRVSPIALVAGWGVLLLVLEAFAVETRRRYLAQLATVGLVLAFGLQLYLLRRGISSPLFSGRLMLDGFAYQMGMLFTAAAALTTLLAPTYLEAHDIDLGEFYPLLLFSVSGMLIIAAAGELLVLVIGIETMSLPMYALCASWRRREAGQREDASVEAAFKYYLMGAFSTAVALYGVALIYGATGGHTTFAALATSGALSADKPFFVIGVVMLIAGLGFKVAAVPFHMWTPDVYEGAPTPVTGFMAAAVKAAAFAAVLRVFTVAFRDEALAFGPSGWTSLLAVVAAATMVLGNLTALWQQNVKRMLAYSSIAHAGYLLVGVLAAASEATRAEARSAVVFYLWAYTFTTLGAFGLVAWIGRREERERLLVEDFAGLAYRSPAAALGMTVFLLSLAGVPPTAGFFGKFFLFKTAVVNPSLIWLVVLGLLTSVVSVFYYLRIVVAMYFRDPVPEDADFSPLRSAPVHVALVTAALFVLAVGLYPTSLWNLALRALMGS
jgi:NADH-quinone oxidoreductase subunit N